MNIKAIIACIIITSGLAMSIKGAIDLIRVMTGIARMWAYEASAERHHTMAALDLPGTDTGHDDTRRRFETIIAGHREDEQHEQASHVITRLTKATVETSLPVIILVIIQTI
jgi:hypothetical protein